ncbi:MAG: PD-(D/E)XK motif protein [Bryobacter sp.]|nr:PD-(D/E)XK motif protein [Bryobacter sp. CoA8 C33]
MKQPASTSLIDLFESLVLPLERPASRSLSAVPVPGAETHRLAKDASGAPYLLLRQVPSPHIAPPTRLQNLMVTYCTPCVVAQPGGMQEDGVFTIIKCSSSDPSLFQHFLKILSPIVVTLGPAPSGAAVRLAISGLVDLFQALTTPAKKSVQGLWAELLLIRYASNPLEVVAAWHGTPQEHIDFVSGGERLEVKSSSTRERVHHFSLAQLVPPTGTRVVIVSVFVEAVGGGLSLRRLSDEIRVAIASDPVMVTRFDAIFYATLGAGWSDAMDECFDLELARDSLQFFDAAGIPKIDGPIPSAVRNVRFISDLSTTQPLESAASLATGLFAAAAPVR